MSDLEMALRKPQTDLSKLQTWNKLSGSQFSDEDVISININMQT